MAIAFTYGWYTTVLDSKCIAFYTVVEQKKNMLINNVEIEARKKNVWVNNGIACLHAYFTYLTHGTVEFSYALHSLLKLK